MEKIHENRYVMYKHACFHIFFHLVPTFPHDIVVEKGLLSGSYSDHNDIYFC